MDKIVRFVIKFYLSTDYKGSVMWSGVTEVNNDTPIYVYYIDKGRIIAVDILFGLNLYLRHTSLNANFLCLSTLVEEYYQKGSSV